MNPSKAAVLAAVAVLVVATVPMPATAANSLLAFERNGQSGDTYTFKINSDGTGQSFRIVSGSTITMTAFYPAVREDFGIAFALTDLLTTAQASVFYGTFRDTPGTRLEVISDTVGPEVNLQAGSVTGALSGVEWTVTFGSSFQLPDRDWYLTVSTPEAVQFDVDVDLITDPAVSLRGEGTASNGLLASTRDFDGTTQLQTNDETAAVNMRALAQAPSGTRGFGLLLPTPGSGIVRYGIDGPGDSDDVRTLVALSNTVPTVASVILGPPGPYRHFVDAELWQHSTVFESRVAIFFAAPMPL